MAVNTVEPLEPWLAPRVRPWLLIALAVVALLARAIWIWRYGHVIENQGVAYARVAQSLAEGSGYIGILGDRYTLQGPLFSWLIVAVAPLAGSIEMAARVVSCLAGVALIFPIYSIATALSGRRRAGLVAAGLVAGHGVPMGFAAATYGEGLYFFLLLAAAASVLRAAGRPADNLTAAAAGALFGLAYLVRPETIAYVLVAATFLVIYDVAKKQLGRRTVQRGALLVLAFAAFVTPYGIWLSSSGGGVRIEGKSDYNAIINEGMGQGMSFAQAARRITPDLQPVGADMFADQFAIPRSEESGLVRAASTVLDAPIQRGLSVLRMWISDPNCGGVLLAVLAVAGLLATFMGPREKVMPAFFACMTFGYVGLILSVRFFDWDRYIYPFTYFALVWAGLGISATATAAGQICAVLGTSLRLQVMTKVAAVIVLAVPVCLLGLGARYAPVFQESHMPWAEQLKTAGLWIREHSDKPPLVMGVSAVVPYYARGPLAYLPWTSSPTALRYVHALKPDFIVLRSAESQSAPYIDVWLREGIPDSCAVVVERMPEPPADSLIIYRWSCAHEK